MKQLITTLLFILLGLTVQAQNFDMVDKRVKNYPSRYSNADQLAAQINKDFSTDLDKVRAIYAWLTYNVSYDLETLYSGNTQINFSYTDEADLQRKLAAVNINTVNKTLRSSKAICEGYAQTFKRVSELLEIPCMLIGGFAKGDISDINSIPDQENHAWNAVKINRKWHLIDATWGAGYTNGNRWIRSFNDFFFLTDPEKFALTHFPSEPIWFLMDKKISKQDFYNTPIFENGYFENKLKLISPLSGELIVKPASQIAFKIGPIAPNTTLYYAYRGNSGYTVKLEPDCSNGDCTFEVPFNGDSNSELLIFANQRSAILYKVKVAK